jgi:hypothetical protein
MIITALPLSRFDPPTSSGSCSQCGVRHRPAISYLLAIILIAKIIVCLASCAGDLVSVFGCPPGARGGLAILIH